MANRGGGSEAAVSPLGKQKELEVFPDGPLGACNIPIVQLILTQINYFIIILLGFDVDV